MIKEKIRELKETVSIQEGMLRQIWAESQKMGEEKAKSFFEKRKAKKDRKKDTDTDTDGDRQE